MWQMQLLQLHKRYIPSVCLSLLLCPFLTFCQACLPIPCYLSFICYLLVAYSALCYLLSVISWLRIQLSVISWLRIQLSVISWLRIQLSVFPTVSSPSNSTQLSLCKIYSHADSLSMSANRNCWHCHIVRSSCCSSPGDLSSWLSALCVLLLSRLMQG